MPEDPQNPQTPPATPPAQPPNSSTPATPPAGDATPDPVPYSRFKEVNDALKELRTWREQQEAMSKAAAEKKMAEDGKLKELLETREKELAAERLRNTRQQVAMAKGIPAELVDRLQGATEEELQADADRLLAYIKPASGPGVPPSSRTPAPANVDLSKMSAKEIREALKTANA